MATLTVGRICLKTAGREAGRYCCVLKKIDNNFFLISGPKILTGVKRRKCNVEHLEPTPYSVEIKEEAEEKAVIEAYEKAGLLKKLGLRKPSPEVVKETEKKVEKPKKEVKKPEKKEVEKKPKVEKKVEKEEKKPEKKGGMAIKIKLPTIKRAKKPEKKEEIKPEKKEKPKKVVEKKETEKKKKTEEK